jgi:hypothetical protein
VRRHVWSKRSHLLRKTLARLCTQTLNPVSQRSLDRLEEFLDLGIGEFLSEYKWRELCFEENLVRIRVADATENPRIGEGAF